MREEPAMEGDRQYADESRREYALFRALVRESVEYLLNHHPVSAKADHFCKCDGSFVAFREAFPTAGQRKEIIHHLKRARRRSRKLMRSLNPL